MSPRPTFTARRFAGSQADELAILCRAADPTADPSRQAEAIYRELAAQLTAERASLQHLFGETLFLRDIRRDLEPVLAARARVLGEHADAPAPAR